jgi:hypothetical protein
VAHRREDNDRVRFLSADEEKKMRKMSSPSLGSNYLPQLELKCSGPKLSLNYSQLLNRRAFCPCGWITRNTFVSFFRHRTWLCHY